MSDVKKDHADHMEIEKRKLELQKTELTLRERRAESQISSIEQNDKELEIAKNTNFARLTQDQVDAVRADNREYINAAKSSMMFINKEFDGIVPFFRKNLIFIGAPTGNGKSTTVANIVWETIRQKRPDGSPRRVLVITNEEQTEDVYNRVTCLAKGWNYVNHDQFTPEQLDTFDQWIGTLSSGGRVTVVDNKFNGAIGATTTIEGLCMIFDNLIRDKEFFDVVVIDYYQNFKTSKRNPSLDEWKVQAMVAAALDQYKNLYPAPIVLLGQINKPKDEEDTTPFEFRIKGRKSIIDVATCMLEMYADRENYRTTWVYHKGRFNENVGKKFHTGFTKGKYVPYDNAFITEVARTKEQRMMDKLNGSKLKAAMGDKKPTGDDNAE